MKKNIVLYFSLDLNYVISKYRIFDIGKHSNYFNSEDFEYINNLFNKKINPALKVLKDLSLIFPNFKVNFGLSTYTLSLIKKYSPFAFGVILKLIKNKKCEIVFETHLNQIEGIYSKTELKNFLFSEFEIFKKELGKMPDSFKIIPPSYSKELTEVLEQLKIKRVFENISFNKILELEGGVQTLNLEFIPFILKQNNLSITNTIQDFFKKNSKFTFVVLNIFLEKNLDLEDLKMFISQIEKQNDKLIFSRQININKKMQINEVLKFQCNDFNELQIEGIRKFKNLKLKIEELNLLNKFRVTLYKFASYKNFTSMNISKDIESNQILAYDNFVYYMNALEDLEKRILN